MALSLPGIKPRLLGRPAQSLVTTLTELPGRIYSRGIRVAIRSDAIRRVVHRITPQVLEGLADSFAIPAVCCHCCQGHHSAEEPMQCHLQQEHEMQWARRVSVTSSSTGASHSIRGAQPRSAHVRSVLSHCHYRDRVSSEYFGFLVSIPLLFHTRSFVHSFIHSFINTAV